VYIFYCRSRKLQVIYYWQIMLAIICFCGAAPQIKPRPPHCWGF
jgi:hypothetical protein